MRVSNSLLKWVMSATLFVLLLVAAGTKNALAQTQVATLQHGEDISVFYGQNAFVEAHTSAQTGDIITLSSGTFTPTNITKAITLRGAGCVIDTVTGIYPTIIPNNFQMNVTNNDAFLTIEGIYFSGTVSYGNLNHPKFIKCNIENLSYCSGANMQNAQFVNCKVKYFDFYYSSNTTLINCVVWTAYGLGNSGRTVNAYNSIIRPENSHASAMNAYNCIIIQGGSGVYTYGLQGNSSAYNCIGIGNNALGCTTFNCLYNRSYSQVFETFTGGNFSFDETFILKEEIATGFLGNDGTEVGIHGGIMPYSSRPSYMVIEQCNVANRSTIDGKLSVEIEVSTQGE